jgi:hypothetical protein
LFTRKTSATKRPSLRAIFPLSLIAFTALAGCGGGGGGGSTVTTTAQDQPGWSVQATTYKQATKPWTFLVYMNAANDLDTYGLANINQMEHVGSTSNLNVVVQIKRGHGYDTNAQYTFDSSDGGWSGTRRYYVTGDSNDSHINSLQISSQATLDMGDPKSLQDFVQWGISAFPAQHYCLVVWNHGSGWRAQPVHATTGGRGVSFDDVSSDYIKTTELPGAIDMGGGRKWDLVTIDASLMQMTEIAYQLKDKTQYIVGSEESPPGGGYPYDQILADLNTNPGMDGRAFGLDIAQKTYAFYQGAPTVGGTVFDVATYGDFLTQSVLDTSKLSAVASSLNNLGNALLAASGKYPTQIAAARDNSDSYGVHDLSSSDPTYPVYYSYRDPLDFIHRLIDTLPGASGPAVPDSGVLSAAAQARAAYQAAILVNYHGAQHAGSNGLALYIPSPTQYVSDDREQAAGSLWYSATTNNRYSDLALPQAAPGWQSFLTRAPQ